MIVRVKSAARRGELVAVICDDKGEELFEVATPHTVDFGKGDQLDVKLPGIDPWQLVDLS